MSNFKFGLFGSIYFIGFAIGAITLLRLGDTLGRKPVLVLTSILNPIFMLGLAFGRNLMFLYVMIFLAGCVSIARSALFYLYMLEIIPDSKRVYFHAIMMFFGGIVGTV